MTKAFHHDEAVEGARAESAALALDVPRVITLRNPKTNALYTWQMRRVTHDDWARYFAGIVHQTINEGETRSQVFDSESALIELVTRVVEAVSGYGAVPAGKWREMLPERHRRAVGLALCGVGPSGDQADSEMLSELIEVKLDATWSSAQDPDDHSRCKTQLVRGLVHRFRHPSIAQLKRYNFEVARVRVTGSAESGVTSYPSRQGIAMRLYDELIVSVEGYTVQGCPLADVEAIVREMDGAHKAAAALELFGGKNEVAIV